MYFQNKKTIENTYHMFNRKNMYLVTTSKMISEMIEMEFYAMIFYSTGCTLKLRAVKLLFVIFGRLSYIFFLKIMVLGNGRLSYIL